MDGFPQKNIHITILVCKAAFQTPLAGALDIFNLSNLIIDRKFSGVKFPRFQIKLVTPDDQVAQFSDNFSVSPHCLKTEIIQTDLIFIPGMEKFINDDIRKDWEELIPWLRHHHKQGTIIAASCTGPLLVAETGLLDGKQATANWTYMDQFRKYYPKVNLNSERIIIDEGEVITAGASTATLDLALYLVEHYLGPEVRMICAKLMLINGYRASQLPYFTFYYQNKHNDEEIKNVQQWIGKNYSKKILIDELAKSFGMSPRNFVRRFKQATGDNPSVYIQKTRVSLAKNRLELTKLSIYQIMLEVGYNDLRSFIRLFTKHVGITPAEYRKTFNRV